jgi:hypothetical protein
MKYLPATLITRPDGVRVIKNILGGTGKYTPTEKEKAFQVMARPTTGMDIERAFIRMGIGSTQKRKKKLVNALEMALTHDPKSLLAYGYDKYGKNYYEGIWIYKHIIKAK